MVWLKDLWDNMTFPIRYWIDHIKEKTQEKERIKKIKELQKRDPFIYK